MRARAAGLALVAATAAAPARADAPMCHVVDVELTPASGLQLVAWVEDPGGRFVDTVFVTQLTGRYGLGNRPGLKDLNSAWHWPYGRREMVLPVWAHRHGFTFPKVVFQNLDETDISHPAKKSSVESFYCQPLLANDPRQDTQTCATEVFTDKGMLSSDTSLYPPRVDVATVTPTVDDPSVAMFKALDVFDAVSMATPAAGMDTTIAWPIPPGLAPGEYVLFVEASQEFDFNDTYNPTTYPEPTLDGGAPLPWGNYGAPSRGQPSVVYRVPFTVGDVAMTASTSTYVGYGDPEGVDGTLHPPDATITTDTPGSGGARLQLTADGQGGTFRVRVSMQPDDDATAPAAPADPTVVATDQQSATIAFTEPGDDGTIGRVAGYDVRVRAGAPITADNFDASMPIAATVTPRGAGATALVTVDHLLPETEYWIGVRAYDECKNRGPLAIFAVTTTARQSGYVDACFVATAAYGSKMANDVELLRRFRDQYLETNVLGELAVETYYSVGPAMAGVIDQSEPLRATVRDALAPIVDAVRGLTGR